jgi:hypothetical protein
MSVNYQPLDFQCNKLWPGNWRHTHYSRAELAYGDIIIKVENLCEDRSQLIIGKDTDTRIYYTPPGETIEEQFIHIKRRLQAFSVCISQIMGKCPSCEI